MTIETILYIASSILDMVIVMVYFRVVYERRTNVPNLLRVGAFVLVYFGFYLIDIFSRSWVLNISYSIISLFLLSFLYKSKIRSKVFVAFSFEVFATLAEMLGVGIMELFKLLYIWDFFSLEQTHYYVMLVSKLILFLIIMLVSTLLKKKDVTVPFKYQIYLIIIPTISIGIALNVYFQIYKAGNELDPPSYASLVGILTINIVVYYLLENIIGASDLRERQTRMESQLSLQEQKYQQTTASFKRMNGIIHDTNKHLLYLKECFETGDGGEGIRYVEQALNHMDKSYKRIQTGFLVVDALVSNALNVASSYQIDFKTDIKVEKERINIDSYDLSVVLGNLLDNAVEACKNMEFEEEKFIKVGVYTSEYTLAVNVANSMVKESVGTGFITSKKDKEKHGYGIQNLEAVVEKYGGSMNFNNGERTFDVTVILPL